VPITNGLLHDCVVLVCLLPLSNENIPSQCLLSDFESVSIRIVFEIET